MTLGVRHSHDKQVPPFQVAEFFAGIGLMRTGLEAGGPFKVVWANDIQPSKHRMYRLNHPDDPSTHFLLGDVRNVTGDDLPQVALATASFPCTDLSLAGDRHGLVGTESGTFWEFHRVLEELDGHGQLPRVCLLENVVGFATSRGGADLEQALVALNRLGYVCDLFVVDAAWFVPQSRPRVFVVGALKPGDEDAGWAPSILRPPWVGRFVDERPHLKVQARPLPTPAGRTKRFSDVVERLAHDDEAWWEAARVDRFVTSLSKVQAERLRALKNGSQLVWRTAYRRTRQGRAVWEIRGDEIAGCLRTARGGSSRQGVVEAGRGEVRVRWMTPREYARLQGAPEYRIDGFRPNEIYFGFGDAVCVPVIAWIARNYLTPLLVRPS